MSNTLRYNEELTDKFKDVLAVGFKYNFGIWGAGIKSSEPNKFIKILLNSKKTDPNKLVKFLINFILKVMEDSPIILAGNLNPDIRLLFKKHKFFFIEKSCYDDIFDQFDMALDKNSLSMIKEAELYALSIIGSYLTKQRYAVSKSYEEYFINLLHLGKIKFEGRGDDGDTLINYLTYLKKTFNYTKKSIWKKEYDNSLGVIKEYLKLEYGIKFK